ncbi:MAG: hypothetical protein RIR52_1403 [Acidobacteriota bacterium]|jgi:hypothetical protein|nr:hypothetical protein [Acidobacteriota bacterium]
MKFNFDGPSDSSPRPDPQRTAEIRRWTAEVFNLTEGTKVLVAELQCMDEECPPIETVIAVLDTPGSARQYKIHKPVMDIEYADVISLAQKPEEDHQY